MSRESITIESPKPKEISFQRVPPYLPRDPRLLAANNGTPRDFATVALVDDDTLLSFRTARGSDFPIASVELNGESLQRSGDVYSFEASTPGLRMFRITFESGWTAELRAMWFDPSWLRRMNITAVDTRAEFVDRARTILLSVLADHVRTLPTDGSFPTDFNLGPYGAAGAGRTLSQLLTKDPMTTIHIVSHGTSTDFGNEGGVNRSVIESVQGEPVAFRGELDPITSATVGGDDVPHEGRTWTFVPPGVGAHEIIITFGSGHTRKLRVVSLTDDWLDRLTLPASTSSRDVFVTKARLIIRSALRNHPYSDGSFPNDLSLVTFGGARLGVRYRDLPA